MLKNTALSTMALAALSTLLACGGINEEDAKKAWAATQKALDTSSAGQALTAIQALYDVEAFSNECSEGGRAEFKMAANVNVDDITSVKFDYEVTFSDCEEDGVITNGTIVYRSAVETGEAGTTVVLDYDGDLTYSGEVNGACEVTLDARVETSASGTSVAYSGKYCGHDGEVLEEVDVNVDVSGV